MDSRPEVGAADSVVLSGLGSAIGLPCSSDEYLRTPKNRKFMGAQDHLAVCAAGRALASAALTPGDLGTRAGLFLAVGFIPFERQDIDALITSSLEGDRISLPRFGREAFSVVNPLLTFRCLPNMPAYHVSACFDIQGEYYVTYPGAGQFYAALQEAIDALTNGRIAIALVGSVADQTNFLVTHHHQRLRPPVPPAELRDGAGFLVLERAAEHDARRGPHRGRVLQLTTSYSPHDPFSRELTPSETFTGCPAPDGCFGAASLPIALATAASGTVDHALCARDGIIAQSRWSLE